MNKKIQKFQKKYEAEAEKAFDFTHASSVTECTGLTPTPPLTGAEYESYLNIYDYKPKIIDDKSDKKRKKR